MVNRIRWQDRVVMDIDLHHGDPCIRGTRIPVVTILGSLADGLDAGRIREAYPQLTDADIAAALAYAAEVVQGQQAWIPNEVVERVIIGKLTPIRAWREHLGLTQTEAAVRLEISQAAFAQLESPEARLRKTRLHRVAQALGIDLEQLDF